LLGLALATLVPTVVAITYGVMDSADSALDNTYRETRAFAGATAADLDIFLSSAETLLQTVANRPLIRALDENRCDPLIRDFPGLLPEFANLTVWDSKGRSVCGFRANTLSAQQVMASPWFQAGIKSSGLLVGDAAFGRISKRWVSILTYPVRDPLGDVKGVLAVPIDLRQLQQSIISSAPDNTVISVFDSRGTFLMRSIEPERWIGENTGNPEVVEAARLRADRFVRERGGDGVLRAYANRPVSRVPWMVAAGIPEDVAFAGYNEYLERGLMIGLFALLLGVAMAYRLSATIARPIRKLERVLGEVAAGDLKARATTEGPLEIAKVAVEFNRMLDSRDRMERDLRESVRRFGDLLGNVKLVSMMLDTEARITYCNDHLLTLTGWKREELLGRNWFDLFVPPDLANVRPVFSQLLLNKPQAWHYENEILTRSGERRLIHWNNSILRTAEGAIVGTASLGEDVTEKRQAEHKVNRLNRVHAVLSGINGLIVRARDRDQLFREACRIAVEAGEFRLAWLGLVDRGAMQVRPSAWHGEGHEILESIPLSLDANLPQGQGMVGAALRTGRPVVFNDLERVSAKSYALQYGLRSVAVLPLLVQDEAVGVLALYSAELDFLDDAEMKLLAELADDISFALSHIQQMEKLDYLAYYDALTGLANRTLFHERLAQEMQAAQREKRRLAVAVVNVDRFRAVNDALGRQAGDELLKQIAGRLSQAATDPARVARFGADYFAILLPDVRAEADIARRIDRGAGEYFKAPFQIAGTEVQVSVRAGVAVFPNDGGEADLLLANAEEALVRSRQTGERYVFYTPRMNERVAELLALETQLRQALVKNEFVLHYQPKVDLATRRILGVEALIRWNSPERGLVPPSEFIPLMEQTGLILEVGAWALRQAAADHRRWMEDGLAAPRIAVNVSAIQLRRPDFVRTVAETSADGTPSWIDIEITESVLMEDVETTVAKLEALRELGVSIAIDDFGTGYSSLAYLARLPVQTLKIDRSFVNTMLIDSNVMTVVSTMISMAHNLNAQVVAEGVETEEQAKALLDLGCDQMQGYLFSRPLPLDAMTALLGGDR
jgi:diguanylate cyclase (GGDEF)-like protein/PAS domain S-box-containing protein